MIKLSTVIAAEIPFLEYAPSLWNYWLVIALMMIGLYIVIATENLVKTIMGLSIFQASVIMLYVSMGKVSGGSAPIMSELVEKSGNPLPLYANPVPHVLMLTAIVVGVATVAVGSALAVRIQEAYGTCEEDLLRRADLDDERRTANAPEKRTSTPEGTTT